MIECVLKENPTHCQALVENRNGNAKKFFLNVYILSIADLTMLQAYSKVIWLYMHTYIIFEIIFHYRLL